MVINISSIIRSLAFGVIDESEKTSNKTDNKKDTQKGNNDKQIKIARKEQLLDEFKAAILREDAQTAVKLKAEILKLSDVTVSPEKLLEELSVRRAELLDMKEAALLRGENVPERLDKEMSKVNLLIGTFKESLKLPMPHTKMWDARKTEYQSAMNKVAERYPKLVEFTEEAILRGEDVPTQVMAEIKQFKELYSFYQEGLGLKSEDIKIPESMKKRYEYGMELASKRRAELIDDASEALSKGESVPPQITEEIEKMEKLQVFYQLVLGK